MSAKKLLLPLIGAALILFGSLLASLIQTSGGIAIRDIRFRAANGAAMSALLYVPNNASPQNPAPGILAIHGYMNSREMQDGFAIEFARRGYVVLALDQTGHGYSDPPAFSNGFGGPEGLRYLRSLPIVDKANIGLEGHSMGGWAVLAAAAAFPDGYKAIVLEGSSTGRPFAREGAPDFPRNLAVVFSRYDEFSRTMWGAPRGADAPHSPKLMKAFGTDRPVEIGKVYGDIAAGNARVLFAPPITHAQDHFSTEAIGHALTWFERTLEGGVSRAPEDQIWFWKEFGTLIALIGFIVLLMGAFDLLLSTPLFAPLRTGPISGRDKRDVRWALMFALTIAIPALTYLPVCILAGRWLPASPLAPQAFTNQIAVWALVNAAITAGLSFVLRSKSEQARAPAALSVLIALATLAIGYGALALVDALFKVDFRFWIVAFKLLSAERVATALFYAVPLTLYFVLALGALHRTLTIKNGGALSAYAANIAALAGGFVIFHIVQYGALFATGALFSPDKGLLVIIGLQFIPLMAIVAILSTFAHRRSGSALPGALLCAWLVAWYIVAGQAMQAQPLL